MKLSEVMNKKPKPEPKTETVTTPPVVTKIIDEVLAEPSIVDQIAVVHLAEEAIRAVDAEREAKARASLAREALTTALDTMKLPGVEALGRTLKFKTTSTPETTLKNIKGLIGEIEGKKLWDNLPRKTYRSLDIPKSSDSEPEGD